MKIVNRMVSILLILVGALIIYQSTKFDFMVEGTPGPGFMPFWLGIAISVVALIPLVRTFTKFASKLENPFQPGDFRPFFIYLGGGLIIMILTPLLGLMLPLGLMVGISAWMAGTKSRKTLLGITVLTPVIMYIVFDFLLGVPLPKGLFNF